MTEKTMTEKKILVAIQKGKDMDKENCRVGKYSMWSQLETQLNQLPVTELQVPYSQL